MGGHIGDQPYEFFIRLYRAVRSSLRLPTPFTRVMVRESPQSLRLHMRGCGNGNIWADIEFSCPRVMYLHQGWKTFACAYSLTEGHVLHFKLMDNSLLSITVLRELRNLLRVLRGEFH